MVTEERSHASVESAVSNEDDVVAPPPPMPVQSALYITPDGRVQFGALFAELVPVARALDPAFDPEAPCPPAVDGNA